MSRHRALHLYQFQFLLIYLHICHLSSLFSATNEESGKWQKFISRVMSGIDDATHAPNASPCNPAFRSEFIPFCTVLLNHKISLNLWTILLEQVKRTWNMLFAECWQFFQFDLCLTHPATMKMWERKKFVEFLNLHDDSSWESNPRSAHWNVSKVIIVVVPLQRQFWLRKEWKAKAGRRRKKKKN